MAAGRKIGGDRNLRTGKVSKADATHTPESATSLEKARLDDEAVSKAVTASERALSGTQSVLPGPPIPPAKQAEVRKESTRGDAEGDAVSNKKK